MSTVFRSTVCAMYFLLLFILLLSLWMFAVSTYTHTYTQLTFSSIHSCFFQRDMQHCFSSTHTVKVLVRTVSRNILYVHFLWQHRFFNINVARDKAQSKILFAFIKDVGVSWAKIDKNYSELCGPRNCLDFFFDKTRFSGQDWIQQILNKQQQTVDVMILMIRIHEFISQYSV